MKFSRLLSAVVITVLFVSCNGGSSPEKQADEKLSEIEQLIADNDWATAKLKIDSIHTLFPRLVDKRRIAVALADTISRRESARMLAYCDSILPVKKAEADSLMKFFRFEKDEKYQEVGNYVYKSQITEQNTGRNYLKCYVDEKANFYLVSNVGGSRINHRNVMVSAGDGYATTENDSVAKGVFHSFTTDGQYFENLTFTNADGGIGGFVAANRNEKIKVTLLGSKKIEYQLPESDKKAIEASYHLWIVKKDIMRLEREILKAQVIIGNINLRHSI